MTLTLSNPDHDGERLCAVVRAILGSTELCSMATLADDVATGEAENRAQNVHGTRFPLFRELSKSPDATSAGPSFRLLRLYEFPPGRVRILEEEQLGDEMNVTAEIRRG